MKRNSSKNMEDLALKAANMLQDIADNLETLNDALSIMNRAQMEVFSDFLVLSETLASELTKGRK